MYLKSLIERELGEGLTEDELAVSMDVPRETITGIIEGLCPVDAQVWEKLAQYFRMETDFLRNGILQRTRLELSQLDLTSALGQYRKVPLLGWGEIDQMVARQTPPCEIRSEAMLETEVPGERIFALQAKDDSMAPLFNEGEILFVNPDLLCEPGHYVVAGDPESPSEQATVRQLKKNGSQYALHPLNRKYEDVPLRTLRQIKGRVVRLRKNL